MNQYDAARMKIVALVGELQDHNGRRPADVVKPLTADRCSDWIDALAKDWDRRADEMESDDAMPGGEYRAAAMRQLARELRLRAESESASTGKLTRCGGGNRVITTPAMNQDALPLGDKTAVIGAAHDSAITIAHEWLRKSREELGPMREWTQENRDNYHRDLGLLVDFATDCWPNAADQQQSGGQAS